MNALKSLMHNIAKMSIPKRVRKLVGLTTAADRMELFEERRRIFNLQRGHAHPAIVSAARRHGMDKN